MEALIDYPSPWDEWPGFNDWAAARGWAVESDPATNGRKRCWGRDPDGMFHIVTLVANPAWLEALPKL